MTDDRMTMDARAEAIEVMARAMFAFVWPLEDWDEYELATETTEEIQEDWRKQAATALDALLSPRTVPCSTCNGTGQMGTDMQPVPEVGRKPGVGVAHCWDCGTSGQVSLPPLAVLMGSLEQVGWALVDKVHPDHVIDVRGHRLEKPALTMNEVPVFRFRSREEEGT